MTELAADLAARLREVATAAGAHGPEWRWPSATYQQDPLGFFEREMGCELWGEQATLVQAVQESPRVAVRGGRKVGKDFVLALLAWWFFESYPGARVRFISVTDEQSRDVFWREVKARWRESGRCLACRKRDPNGPKPCPHAHPIVEQPAELPATGVRAPDGREIVGFTANSAEAAAGVSGPYQLYIVDEASDVPDFIFDAILGNLGGCVVGLLVCLSNPTRNAGAFYKMFHEWSRGYRGVHMSSRRSPNVLAGRIVVPGLATAQWIAEMQDIYGLPSEWITIHVDGDFVRNPEGTVFSIEMIDAAVKRWATTTSAEPVLTIGADIAGASDRSDDSAFAARRGLVVLEVVARRGLDPDTGAHVVEILALLAKHRQKGDRVRVVIDREGEQGIKVWRRLQEFLALPENGEAFELVGVRASARAMRDPKTYQSVRDELAASLKAWLRDGGALPDVRELREDLKAYKWIPQVTGRSKLMPKPDMRLLLGRSPDRGDAVQLCTWEAPPVPPDATFRHETPPDRAGQIVDPYARNEIDPYGSR
jgi:phage terminase large subunit